MSLSYNTILRNVAIRINAIEGTTASDLETNYVVSPLTTTQVVSADFSFTPIKDAILLAEEKLAHAIANVGNHPWRRFLNGITASIAHQGIIPSTDASSNPIVGIYGAVRDASDGTICTEMPLEVIRRRVRNANSFYRAASYFYKIDGVRIEHTRTNVTIDVCVYNRTTQQTAINTLTNNTVLPDALEEALVCGAVSYLVRDDAFSAQAALYRTYFQDTLAMIARGLTSVSSKSIPSPFQTVGAT